MSFVDVVTAITTVGFPIVMCLLEGWYIVSRADKTRDTLEKNNVVMTELKEVLNSLSDDIREVASTNED